MAYKDEYEVARLYTDGAFRQRLAAAFEGDLRLTFHLAPPLLARRDPVTGEPRKRAYGSWMWRVLGLVAKMRFLRGTPFDPFGHTAERRMERRLIEEYFETVDGLLAGLRIENLELAVEIASVPELVRGYGHVKARANRRSGVGEGRPARALAGGWRQRSGAGSRRLIEPALGRDHRLLNRWSGCQGNSSASLPPLLGSRGQSPLKRRMHKTSMHAKNAIGVSE